MSYTGIGHVNVLPVNPVGNGYGNDGDGRLVVFPADPMEANNSRRVATDFDLLAKSQVNPTIDPPANPALGLPADQDWYRFVAPQTGTFRFQLAYQPIGTLPNGNPGLPGDGDLLLSMYDADGNSIAKTSGDGDGSQTVGVEQGATYYVCVQGATPDSVNVYNIDLINVDTFGPQVTGVAITGANGYNLFSQEDAGVHVPTPLVNSLTLGVQDLVARCSGYLYPALDQTVDLNPGHYRLVGDSNGVVPIATVSVVNDPVSVGNVATGDIVLGFAQPLPDDRYTLTVFSSVQDPAGNALDGETNTIEPLASPVFPSGDGVAGGDFVARFTVNSRPHIGTWSAGSVYLDTNGNNTWDPTNRDYVNRDLTLDFGCVSDNLFAGNFASPGAATADGFSKLGDYGVIGTTYRWVLDTNNDGVPDLIKSDDPSQNINALPVAGNFDGNAADGDEVGLFDGKNWYLDTSRTLFDPTKSYVHFNTVIPSKITGYPIVGDFNGNGHIDLATYRNGTFYFQLWSPSLGYNTPVQTVSFGFMDVRARPVAADIDQDGVTDVGLWVPDRSGATGSGIGEWYFIVSHGKEIVNSNPAAADQRAIQVSPTSRIFDFSPTPLGGDIFAQFGNSFAMPIVGRFDPPINPDGSLWVSSSPANVSLVGTSANDRFEFSAGNTPGTWTISLDGSSQTINAASINVSFDGLGGVDTAVFHGIGPNQQADLQPGSADFRGEGFHVHVSAESITVDPGNGSGTAVFHDRPHQTDYFVGAANYALLSDLPGGKWKTYADRANGFQTVQAYSTAGDTDQAVLAAAAGAVFNACGTWAQFGSNDVYGFRYVTATGSSGQTANFDAASPTDQFAADPHAATMSGTAWADEGVGFGNVRFVGVAGGTNDATLSNAAISSLFQVGKTSAHVTGQDAKKSFSIWVENVNSIVTTLKNKRSRSDITKAINYLFDDD